MSEEGNATKRWSELSREQRRVAGVLVEKSKTTPDVYPMTVNAITSGANQKSNRSPLMNLSQDEVQGVLDQLRQKGAVVEVHGDGRVARFKHCLYEWMGVDKVEMAVMAELLLRGHQTLGELRQRASRMEEIDSLHSMKTIIDRLVSRGLVLELTPPGRGQIVSHNLYGHDELKKIRGIIAAGESLLEQQSGPPDEARSPSNPASDNSSLEARIGKLEEIVDELKERLDQLLN